MKNIRKRRKYASGGWLYSDENQNSYNKANDWISFGASTLSTIGNMMSLLGSAKEKNNNTPNWVGNTSKEEYSPNWWLKANASLQGYLWNKDTNAFVNKAYGGPILIAEPKPHKFGSGGLGMAGGIMSAVGDVANIFVNSSKIDDNTVNASKIGILQVANNRPTSNSFDSLMMDQANARDAKTNYTRKDFQGMSSGKRAASGIFNSVGAGVNAALSTGNIWAGIGTLAAGVAGTFLGGARARHQAAELTRTANRFGRNANIVKDNNFASRADTLRDLNDSALRRSFVGANGGLLNLGLNMYGIGGAIDYAFNKEYLDNYKLAQLNKNRMTSGIQYIPEESQYGFGGNLGTNGADFTDGLTYFNVPTRHETNPNGGIPQGISPDGQPNLVEGKEENKKGDGGEIKWNELEYIFSDRLTPSEELIDKWKLPKAFLEYTYADLVRKSPVVKEAEERPNDPTSLDTMDKFLADVADDLEKVKAEKEAKEMLEQLALMSPEELAALGTLLQQQLSQPEEIIDLPTDYDQLALNAQDEYGQLLDIQLQVAALEGMIQPRMNAEGGSLNTEESAELQLNMEPLAQLMNPFTTNMPLEELPMDILLEENIPLELTEESVLEEPQLEEEPKKAEEMSTKELNQAIEDIINYAVDNKDKQLLREARRIKKKGSREEKEEFVDETLEEIREEEKLLKEQEAQEQLIQPQEEQPSEEEIAQLLMMEQLEAGVLQPLMSPEELAAMAALMLDAAPMGGMPTEQMPLELAMFAEGGSMGLDSDLHVYGGTSLTPKLIRALLKNAFTYGYDKYNSVEELIQNFSNDLNFSQAEKEILSKYLPLIKAYRKWAADNGYELGSDIAYDTLEDNVPENLRIKWNIGDVEDNDESKDTYWQYDPTTSSFVSYTPENKNLKEEKITDISEKTEKTKKDKKDKRETIETKKNSLALPVTRKQLEEKVTLLLGNTKLTKDLDDALKKQIEDLAVKNLSESDNKYKKEYLKIIKSIKDYNTSYKDLLDKVDRDYNLVYSPKLRKALEKAYGDRFKQSFIEKRISEYQSNPNTTSLTKKDANVYRDAYNKEWNQKNLYDGVLGEEAATLTPYDETKPIYSITAPDDYNWLQNGRYADESRTVVADELTGHSKGIEAGKKAGVTEGKSLFITDITKVKLAPNGSNARKFNSVEELELDPDYIAETEWLINNRNTPEGKAILEKYNEVSAHKLDLTLDDEAFAEAFRGKWDPDKKRYIGGVRNDGKYGIWHTNLMYKKTPGYKTHLMLLKDDGTYDEIFGDPKLLELYYLIDPELLNTVDGKRFSPNFAETDYYRILKPKNQNRNLIKYNDKIYKVNPDKIDLLDKDGDPINTTLAPGVTNIDLYYKLKPGQSIEDIIGGVSPNLEPEKDKGKKNWLNTALRLAPLFNRPFLEGTSSAGLLADSANNLHWIAAPRHGEDLRYEPTDTLYKVNLIQMANNAANRGIDNASNGNVGLLMANRALQNSKAQQLLGETLIADANINWNRKKDVIDLHNQVDQFYDLLATVADKANMGNNQYIVGARLKAADRLFEIEKGNNESRSKALADKLGLLNKIGTENELNDIYREYGPILGKAATGGELVIRRKQRRKRFS